MGEISRLGAWQASGGITFVHPCSELPFIGTYTFFQPAGCQKDYRITKGSPPDCWAGLSSHMLHQPDRAGGKGDW